MNSRVLRTLIISCVVIGLLSLSVAVYSQKVSRMRHPNLAAAQEFIEKAVDKITAAQVANEYDMAGHAAKAKSLLDQAYAEVKLAALAANK